METPNAVLISSLAMGSDFLKSLVVKPCEKSVHSLTYLSRVCSDLEESLLWEGVNIWGCLHPMTCVNIEVWL